MNQPGAMTLLTVLRAARAAFQNTSARARALSSAVPLCLLLVGAAVVAPLAARAGQDVDEIANGNGTWLRIDAFTDIPLAGADVAVYTKAGRILFERHGATNNWGIFPAKIKRLPKNFRVTVTWDAGRQGDLSRLALGTFRLSADVQNFDPIHGIVYVNPVTTMVSRLMSRFPELPQNVVEALVRRFLVLPSNASLGAALRQGKYFQSAYFSQSDFLNQATHYGGMEEFIDSLVIDMLARPREKHPFPGALGSSAGGVASFIAENLVKGALSWAGGQGAGWVAQSAGLTTPGATAEDIANLQAGLVDLRSSVDQLSKQLAALQSEVLAQLTQTQYTTIVVPAMNLANQVDGVEKDLTFYAQGCPPVAEDNPPSTGAVSADFCTEQGNTVISELKDPAIRQSFVTLSGDVLDNPTIGFKGLIHLFSQSLGQSIRFFRPADSTKIQNMFDYWDAAQTEAANLYVELLHQEGAQDNPGGTAQLIDFLGNVNANPPTQGVFQSTRTAEQKLMFPTVPVGTVMDTKTRMMWVTEYPNNCYNGNGPPTSGAWNYPITMNMYAKGLPGWQSPTVEQAQTLIDGGGASPMTWLINQTKAVSPDSPESPGFTDVVTGRSPSGNQACPGPWVWTQTATYNYWYDTSGRRYPVYSLLRLDNGTIRSTTDEYAAVGYIYYNFLYYLRGLPRDEQYYWYP